MIICVASGLRVCAGSRHLLTFVNPKTFPNRDVVWHTERKHASGAFGIHQGVKRPMWEKRIGDAQPAAARPEAPAVVSPAQYRVEPATPGTAIGKAIYIKGDIYSEEDLFVDGQVQGTLELKGSRLTIGPN